MKGIVYLLLMLLLSGAVERQAQAAAIDCTHPTLPITRLICNNPTLAHTDEALAEVYAAAAAATLDQPSLEAAESQWYGKEVLSNNWYAERHMPVDAGKLAQAYERHMDALRQDTAAWQAVRAPVAADSAATSCLVLPPYPHDGTCKVTSFGPIEGDPTLRYQLQAFSGDNPAAALVVFQTRDNNSGTLIPLVAGTAHRDGKPAHYKIPGAINAPDGRFLIVDGSFTGGDPADAFVLYRYGTRVAHEIDTTNWLDDLQHRLPAGLMASDINIDYATMTAAVTLMSHSGASGGHATAKLKIDQDRLALRDLKLDAPTD